MKRPTKPTVVLVVLFLVSIWVVTAVGITAVWLTEAVKVLGLMMLPTVIIAGLVVEYFDWRAKRLNRIGDERTHHRNAA